MKRLLLLLFMLLVISPVIFAQDLPSEPKSRTVKVKSGKGVLEEIVSPKQEIGSIS
jgi:hypothetical protein